MLLLIDSVVTQMKSRESQDGMHQPWIGQAMSDGDRLPDFDMGWSGRDRSVGNSAEMMEQLQLLQAKDGIVCDWLEYFIKLK